MQHKWRATSPGASLPLPLLLLHAQPVLKALLPPHHCSCMRRIPPLPQRPPLPLAAAEHERSYPVLPLHGAHRGTAGQGGKGGPEQRPLPVCYRLGHLYDGPSNMLHRTLPRLLDKSVSSCSPHVVPQSRRTCCHVNARRRCSACQARSALACRLGSSCACSVCSLVRLACCACTYAHQAPTARCKV